MTPDSVVPVLLPTFAFVAALVLVVRPLVALLSTLTTDLAARERAFVGWMAPRGIVAASTATTFSASLTGAGLSGADKILPVTFLVIVGTVVVYSLTARPVAARLGVTRPARARPLLVGGDAWVVELARALRTAGIDVLMWAGGARERARIEDAGVELAAGELMGAVTDPQARLEGVTSVFLLTDDDDFNALAAVVLEDSVEGPVHRVGPPPDSGGVVAPTPPATPSSAPHSCATPWRATTSAGPASMCSPRRRRSRRATTPCSSYGATAGWNRRPDRCRSPPPRATPSCSSAPRPRPAEPAPDYCPSSASFRVRPASIRARWVNACGKLPS
ncbi:hypothetical protein [Streptomyces brasiliensis]|uniref:RCK N-terminal domain-containing protein n=1 Tax=Streptomyces brasiliensis TaxID=1954 RepID=A0A917KS28_9ACTN|nr:hypothetical protein [Streptomyces brasiliensis]GGJ27320.1 hypothetical protein GCM10010121_043180 [Streptomyces brasiliensis]